MSPHEGKDDLQNERHQMKHERQSEADESASLAPCHITHIVFSFAPSVRQRKRIRWKSANKAPKAL